MVDTTTRYQTMSGWEAVAQAGQEDPGFAGWQNALFDQAANDVGINRLRLEIRSGSENPADYYLDNLAGRNPDPRCAQYLAVNDNADPLVLNPNGFHFSEVDSAVRKVVLPMKQRLEARGERLFISLTYVAFNRQCSDEFSDVHASPAEYAEFVLAAFRHLRDKFALVPDAVEIILEPNHNAGWTGTLIGQAMVATDGRLSAENFRPAFVAPSTAGLEEAIVYADEIYSVPGAQALLTELSYHRYRGVTDSNLRALAQRASAHGSRTAMLEHLGADVDQLYDDLTLANASAWQQFALAFPNEDTGNKYFAIIDGRPVIGSRTRYLRQYFRYVRMGARRVSARSGAGDVKAVAFVNADGKPVVVVHVAEGRTIELRGLRRGTYGASITTSSATGAELGDHVAAANGTISLSLPAAGVVTVYYKKE
jgi:hypothetical protein